MANGGPFTSASGLRQHHVAREVGPRGAVCDQEGPAPDLDPTPSPQLQRDYYRLDPLLSKESCWNPNPQGLKLWPYLETRSLQMTSN